MKINIKKEVFRKYPDLKVLFILAENVNNQPHSEIKHLLKETEKLIQLQFNKDTIKNHYLIAPWKVAQEEFNSEKHYHTYAEKLIKQVLKRKTTTAKDSVTNILNFLTLKHIIPGGVDDWYKIVGNINFGLAKGNEKKSILKSSVKGDLYYQDDEGILGTKLDSWSSPRTKPTPSSTAIMLHFDILPPITNKELNELKKEAQEILEDFCQAKVLSFVLHKSKNSIELAE